MKLSELDFREHPAGLGGTQAQIEFENGYGASVITGGMFYTTEEKPYEVAVLKGGGLCYDTPITDDVLGYLTGEDVERVLGEIAALPSTKEPK